MPRGGIPDDGSPPTRGTLPSIRPSGITSITHDPAVFPFVFPPGEISFLSSVPVRYPEGSQYPSAGIQKVYTCKEWRWLVIVPFVDVQHKETGAEWSRYFKTDEEAARYYEHAKNDRNLLACIRNESIEEAWRKQQRRRFC
jgi:hypothetical protein